MAGRVISIEIGYSLTRVCEVDYKAKTPKVYKSFTVPTLDGVMNDGMLQIDSHYVEGLRGGLREHNIKAKQVVFSIASSKIANREVVIPFVKENRIADVVRANASEYFPVDLSQYVLAYSVLGVLGEKGSQQYKLLVMAAPVSILEGYYELAEALRLEVTAIDYVGNSLFQAMKKECTAGTQLIAKVDERSTLIMVIQDQKIAFTRNVAYGVDDALHTVMDSGAWGTAKNLRQAIDIVEKNQCIDLTDGEVESEAALTPEQSASRDVTDALKPLMGGIARVIDYYASRNIEVTIDKVLVTGVGANFQGIDELLQKEINYPVEILRKVEGLNLEKFFKDRFFGEYLTCIGAVMAPVGFKKEEGKGKAKGKEGAGASSGSGSKTGLVVSMCFLCGGLVASAVLIAISLLAYFGAQGINTDLQQQVTQLSPVLDVYSEYMDTLTEYNQVEAMYEVTESQNDSLYNFFVELEEKLPSDVNVVSFTCDRQTVTIAMKVSTKGEAAAATEQLRTFDSLIPESVTVASVVTEVDEEEASIYVNFTVSAAYAPVEKGDADAEEAEE